MQKKSVTAIAQDLADPESMIAKTLKLLKVPKGPFDPNGEYTHTYVDGTPFSRGHVAGEVTIRRKSGGRLHIEGYRKTPDKSHNYYTIADLKCRNDELSTPSSWEVESKIAEKANGPAYLNSGLKKRAQVKKGVLKLEEGRSRHSFKLPGRYTCKLCLLDAVQRLPKLGTKEVHFTLIDEYDQICPNQSLRIREKAKAFVKGDSVDVYLYDHIGTATVPGTYCVDASGRLLVYVAGIQNLILTKENDHKTGYIVVP